jgi:hypothetical protein
MHPLIPKVSFIIRFGQQVLFIRRDFDYLYSYLLYCIDLPFIFKEFSLNMDLIIAILVIFIFLF